MVLLPSLYELFHAVLHSRDLSIESEDHIHTKNSAEDTSLIHPNHIEINLSDILHNILVTGVGGWPKNPFLLQYLFTTTL